MFTLQLVSQAPDFKLPATNGRTYSLADFQQITGMGTGCVGMFSIYTSTNQTSNKPSQSDAFVFFYPEDSLSIRTRFVGEGHYAIKATG